jgi:hypothetical protein
MKIFRAKLIFAVLLGCIIAGCNAEDAANNTSANQTQAVNNNTEVVPQDDIEELGRLVKLEFTPEDVTWREQNREAKSPENTANTAKPTEKKAIVAVLKFSPEDAEKITIQAEQHQSPAAAEIDAEDWFPAELIAKSHLAGDETLRGTSYSANDFVQTPYTEGKITRINNTNYFILELH